MSLRYCKETCPVTCVSWHDANEFCRWTTSVLRTAGQIIEVRLPSEAEWEKAVRGTDGRIYPWGNEAPDKEHCNFDRNVSLGDTTPVDKYPKGRSFYDVWDMTGNVWEWTSSIDKKYPYKSDDGREDAVAGAGRRVVRGGSFVDGRDFVRCAYRHRLDIASRGNYIGFRVVAIGS